MGFLYECGSSMAHIPRQSHAAALSQDRGWSRCIEIGNTRLGRAFDWHVQEDQVQLRQLLNVHGLTFHVQNAPSRTHAKRGDVPDVFFQFSVISADMVMPAPPSLPPCAHSICPCTRSTVSLSSIPQSFRLREYRLVFVHVPPRVNAHGLGSLLVLCPTESMPG